ncbi:MAG TPA: hypothetical protein VKY74_00725 [Chloroflexia bacterium]|nr:hypothetical protein [Chloroflexia bacterium]
MWPTYDRYNTAVHQPESCFADAALRASWPVRDRRGLPAPATGAFGCVYHMNSWDRSYALKCFTREVLTSEWRYTEVSAYIRSHPCPYLVECEYLVPRGIMVDGRWYPVLRMDWIEGQTLDQYLEHKSNDQALLATLAESWVGVMRALEERGIAHGDLQHGNILVCTTPDGPVFKLVDYDGMYVPSFKGEEGNEAGLRDYQHPRRSGRDFNEYMDNFAALVIYLGLRALALAPDLWRYHTGENLLFQRKDFDQPAESAVFAALRQLPDPKFIALLDTFEAACLDENPCSLPSLPSLVTGQPALRPQVHPVPPTVKLAPPPAAAPAAAPDTTEAALAEMPVACPNCGVLNRGIARYCRGCALPLPYTALPGNAPLPLVGVAATKVRICPWCGLENQITDRWCLGCTALLD